MKLKRAHIYRVIEHTRIAVDIGGGQRDPGRVVSGIDGGRSGLQMKIVYRRVHKQRIGGNVSLDAGLVTADAAIREAPATKTSFAVKSGRRVAEGAAKD